MFMQGIEADLDGDGIAEAAAVYRRNDSLFLQVFKRDGAGWRLAGSVKAPGYEVSAWFAAPVVSPYRNNLVVGWRIGAEWSKLSIYEWTLEGIADIAPEDLTFSRIEAGRFPSQIPGNGTVELALWMHDTGEAYNVEVVRWTLHGFAPAYDVYPFYFQRVAHYYEQLVRQHPDYRIYWYYLADAQAKTGNREAALYAVDRALAINAPYPTNEALLDLKSGLAEHRTAGGLYRLGGTAGAVSPKLYPAPVKAVGGTRWGYIDSLGVFRLPPQYDDASDFQPAGLAIVQSNGKSGLIDPAGQFIVEPVYDAIQEFSEGRATVIDGEGFRVIDEQGRVLTDKAYSFIANYSDGMAVFQEPSGDEFRYGYLDLQGREAIPATFREAGDFANGKAVVKVKENEYSLIGKNGEPIAMYPYAFVGPLGDGLMAFRKEEDGKYGYIDEEGRIVIEPRYTGAMPFHHGRAIINTAEGIQNRYGLIDRKGVIRIEPKFNDIRDLGEQRYAIGRAIDPERPYIGSTYAIADINGRRLTDYRFYGVNEYRNGLASIYDDELTYFIDTDGRPAAGWPKLEGSGTLATDGKLVKANIDQRIAYYRPSGELVWAPNTAIPLTPPFTVREYKYKPNRDYLVYYPQVQGMADERLQANVNRKLRELSQVKDVPQGQLDYSYTGDFSVPFYRGKLLVLKLEGYNYPFGAAHGMPTQVYVHLNLENGNMYSLKDLFKPDSDYVTVLSNIVGEQIKNDPQYDYVFPDTYQGIQPDQPFYVTGDALHLYFQPYDIAPYAAGFPTFTIPFRDIMNLIDENGEFWKSFHETRF